MTDARPRITRREFARRSLLAAPAVAAAPAVIRAQGRRITTGVIGCGSVSNWYLPVLAASPHIELVSVCDIRPDRARRQAERFSVPHQYPHIDQMLAGAPFEFLVDLTDMQEHERLNRQALEAGKHVWSEKPIANSLAPGQELLRLATREAACGSGARRSRSQSPQFAFMAKTIAGRHAGSRWRPRTRTTATTARTGRRSSTRRGAAACPISRCTTSRR